MRLTYKFHIYKNKNPQIYQNFKISISGDLFLYILFFVKLCFPLIGPFKYCNGILQINTFTQYSLLSNIVLYLSLEKPLIITRSD